MIDWGAAQETYRRDGVVFIPNALDEKALKAAFESWSWSIGNPGPHATTLSQDGDDIFCQDMHNPDIWDGYLEMLQASPIPEMLAKLWGTSDVWFMYEQVFLKKGKSGYPTIWHQDGAYLPLKGLDTAVAWITFDPVGPDNALQFVRGSHRGPLYNAPKYENVDMEPMPDIAADKDAWDIISYPVTPGDLIVFDFKTLHGGAPTLPGMQRRTLTLRFFGARTVFDPRPKISSMRNAAELAGLTPGALFRGADFPKLR